MPARCNFLCYHRCHDPYLRDYDPDANFLSLTFPHIPLSPFSLPLILTMDYSYLMAVRLPLCCDSYVPEGSTYMTQY
jgi:hypothetical protein